MSYNPVNVNGSALSSASSPVVIASDQAEVPVKAGTNLNTSALATQATLASILAKIIAAPATEATLAALALEATQLLIKAKTDNLDVLLSTRLKPADTLAAVTVITNVVHVDDNTGSLTVDAPVGTPVFTRLSDGAAALIGQKAMTASLPVVLSSDQASIPVVSTLVAETTKVIGTVNMASGQTIAVTLASGAAAIAKAEDVASADADVGSPAMAVRKATPVNTSGTDGDYEMLQMSAGRLWASATIDAALPTGANTIGALTANQSVNSAQINGIAPLMGNGATGTGSQRVTIASDNTDIPVKVKPQTSGGWSVFHLVSAATTNATNIKASAGQVGGWYISNRSTSQRKVVFHNNAGTPTAGAGVFFSIDLPPVSAANVFSDIGIPFSTGIAITTVTLSADNDATAVVVNDLIINIFYL